MERREATQVIKEISQSIPHVFISNISVSDLSSGDVELRVVMHTDSKILEAVQSIVQSHQLAIRQEGEALVIGKSRRKTNGFALIS